ncbi:hypothetical protein JCM1841_005040 [Sporobolomyces salmonicolor]
MPAEKGSSSHMSLMLHGAGLVFIYSLYGVLQEKIMKSSTYGPNNEHFTSSSLLIVANRVFSISVGFLILFYKSRQSPEAGSFAQRLRPTSPYFAYASVAVFNFLSTSCQYQALRYVSYTTQSLAKTSKMIPVLVVGALIWKKKHLTREWVAGAVILAGCATYLFSTPPTPHGSHAAAAASADDESWFNGMAGTFFLVGYLFFDGLVSTTQEKVFGKNPASSDPFGPDSPVLDQMIWTNVFAALIASAMAVASSATGSFWPNVELLLTSGSLIWDVCVFSAASAVGLIILLNTIASFGALTSSLIMTIRQFLSILINAGIFGNFSSVSLVGWTGVFWVASGIWIKINKKYDPPKQSKTIFDATSASEENQGMLEKETFDQQKKSNKLRQYAMQYLLPIVLPVVGAILLAPFMATVGQPRVPTASENVAEKTIWAPVVGTNTDSVATVVNPVELGAMESPSNGLAAIVGSSSYDDDANSSTVNSDLNTDTTETPTASDKAAEDALNLVEASEAAALAVSIEGGRWDEELHNAMGPTCKTELVAHAYDAKMSTGFVSYPRSGNSYLRSLIERATGYQTSSIYCDKGLQQTFVGECNHQLQFFVKTHFPALPRIISPDNQDYQDYYKRFDQVVHVVRNPLDAVASWWHLSHVGRTPEGFQNHEGKVDIDKFGDEHRASILDLAERWRRHSVYWAQAPVLTHTLRYEDLKAQPIPHMMSLISYLLPDEDLPPLADIACIAEHDEKLQAYHSRRSSDFATWDKYEPSLREELLSVVRRPFCAFGYQHVLRNAKGDVPEMDGFCDDVGLGDDEYDEAADSWTKRRLR